jgi:hypothetical protein
MARAVVDREVMLDRLDHAITGGVDCNMAYVRPGKRCGYMGAIPLIAFPGLHRSVRRKAWHRRIRGQFPALTGEKLRGDRGDRAGVAAAGKLRRHPLAGSKATLDRAIVVLQEGIFVVFITGFPSAGRGRGSTSPPWA